MYIYIYIYVYIVSAAGLHRQGSPHKRISFSQTPVWGCGYDFTNCNFRKTLDLCLNNTLPEGWNSRFSYLFWNSRFLFWNYSWWNCNQIPITIIKRGFEYGVRAPVFYGNLREQTRENGFPLIPTGSLFCSYKDLRKSPETSGSLSDNVI